MDVDISWLVYESLLPPAASKLQPPVEPTIAFDDHQTDDDETMQVEPGWLESIPPVSISYEPRGGGPPTLPPLRSSKRAKPRGGPPTLPPEAAPRRGRAKKP